MRRSFTVFILFWLLLCGLAFGQVGDKVAGIPIPVDNGDGTYTVDVPLAEAPVDAPVPIEAKGNSFEAVGARLRATFQTDNTVRYEKADNPAQWVTLTAVTVVYDTAPADMARTIGTPVTRTCALSLSAGALESPDVFPNVRGAYEVTDGAVKETLIIDGPFISAIPKTAKLVQFVWRLGRGAGLTHIDHALQGVIVGTDDLPIVLRIEPLEARDVAGAYLAGRCEYQSGFIIGSLDAAWLRAATGPVTIDPTVLAGDPTADLCGGAIFTLPPYYFSPYKLYFKFTLPDIAGGTVTSAEFRAANKGTHVGDTVVGSFVSQDVAWTEASTAATINAITLGTELDSTTITDPWGWWSWDVTGDAAKGIIKAYADSCTEVTIVLRGYDAAVTALQAGLEVQDTSGLSEEENELQSRTDTYPARLYITYSAARTPKPAFAIQGIMSF